MDIVSALKKEESKLQHQLDTIHAAMKILGGKNGVIRGNRPKKRRVSASARAKMAKAQKARWAKVKAAKKNG